MALNFSQQRCRESEMKILRASFFGSMAAVGCAIALLPVSAVVVVTKSHAATPLMSETASRNVARGTAVSPASRAFGPSGYHLLKRIPLGGEGFWDYITFDPVTRRLYISRGTKVVVLEVDSGKVVGEIPNTDGVHGIALVPEFNRGFTSNGHAGTITIFDLKTLKIIGGAQAGANPDAIIYDPSSKRVFAMNGRSKDVTAIDAATGNVVGTIPVDGKPEFAVADGAGHVYVNIEDKSEEQRIDSRNLKVTTSWPLAPCKEPTGLAMDIAHRRLFAGCDNKMMTVMDADSGKIVATPEIGEGVDANAFDPQLQYAYASNGESATLTVVHEDTPDKYSVVENVPTQAHARTMALDPKTHQVFLVTADFGATPPATPENANPRPSMVKDSFVVLILGK
jgi:YVTN family beta-propeller protein